jgi:hypothetical protein
MERVAVRPTVLIHVVLFLAMALPACCTATGMTVGGAVYANLRNPVATGIAGVTVTVEGGGRVFQPITFGVAGLWWVKDVPEGTYVVTPSSPRYSFQYVQPPGGATGQGSVEIEVCKANRARNESIQFWGVELVLDATGAADGHATPGGTLNPPAQCPVTAQQDTSKVRSRYPFGGCTVCPQGGTGPLEWLLCPGVCVLAVRLMCRRGGGVGGGGPKG